MERTHTYFFVVFQTKNVTNYTVRSKLRWVFFSLSVRSFVGYNKYMWVWFIICMYSEHFMLCMSNNDERSERNQRKKKWFLPGYFAIVCAMKQAFRWQYILWWGRNIHIIYRILNILYENRFHKFFSRSFHLALLFSQWILCSLVHFIRILCRCICLLVY